MTDLNTVSLIGRITKDTELKHISTGTAKTEVSLAVNRSIKKADKWEDEASFFNVVVWGKTAENLTPYMTKGKQIAVEGSLIQERWEKDGQKQSRIIIQASNIQLIGGNKDGVKADVLTPETKVTEAFTSLKSAGLVDSSEEFPNDIPF